MRELFLGASKLLQMMTILMGVKVVESSTTTAGWQREFVDSNGDGCSVILDS